MWPGRLICGRSCRNCGDAGFRFDTGRGSAVTGIKFEMLEEFYDRQIYS